MGLYAQEGRKAQVGQSEAKADGHMIQVLIEEGFQMQSHDHKE